MEFFDNGYFVGNRVTKRPKFYCKQNSLHLPLVINTDFSNSRCFFFWLHIYLILKTIKREVAGLIIKREVIFCDHVFDFFQCSHEFFLTTSSRVCIRRLSSKLYQDTKCMTCTDTPIRVISSVRTQVAVLRNCQDWWLIATDNEKMFRESALSALIAEFLPFKKTSANSSFCITSVALLCSVYFLLQQNLLSIVLCLTQIS